MTVTSYKLIRTDAEWMGIGFIDMVKLTIVYCAIYAITMKVLFDLVFCGAVYVGIRIFKLVKPKGWLRDVFTYYLVRSPYYLATPEGAR